jgi:hypothetical protein
MPEHETSLQDRPESDEGTSFGAWTLVSVLYITKVITVVLVIWAAHAYDTAVLVTVTTWYWLGPLLALGAAPLAYRVRLRRVRARRQLLIASEWDLSGLSTSKAPSKGITSAR